MSTYQWSAVGVTVLLSALDGYNVLSISLAAPGIIAEWHISRVALGAVLSMSLVGMAAGSLFVAPLADLLGRRRVVILGILAMLGGSMLSASSGSIFFLSASRVITGLGIGAVVAVINPLAVEYANQARRTLAVGLMTIGFPIGGVLGGWAGRFLLASFGWQSIFWFGAVLALFALPFAVWRIHDPPGFLAERSAGNLATVNSLLSRYGHLPLEELTQPPKHQLRGRQFEIFGSALIRTTALMTIANLLFVMTVYFTLYWIPQTVVDLGFSAAQAAAASATMNMAGILGGVLFGTLARFLGLRTVTLTALAGLGVSTVLFGLLPAQLALVHVCAALVGLFLFSGMVGIYATVADCFPIYCRATGSGFVIGIGRISSAVAPALAGVLFALGLSRPLVFALMAFWSIAAAFAYLFLKNELETPI